MNTTGKFNILSGTEDLSKIIQLDLDFFPTPWTAIQWKELNFSQHLLMEWNDGEGMALFGHLPGDDASHLYKILVHPTKQGHGEAQLFWSAIVQNLRTRNIKSIYLEVESTNERAIRFYLKMGFQTVRKAKAYYSQGGDALIMNLML